MFAIERDHLPQVLGDLLHCATDQEIRATATYLFRLHSKRAHLLDQAFTAPVGLRQILAAPDANSAALAALGKEWAKEGKHRIYFEPLQGWYGLLIERGPQGNVVAIRFRGQPASEVEASSYIRRFQSSKLYFDYVDGCFHGIELWREDFEFIVEQIRTLEREGVKPHDGGNHSL